MLKAQYSSSFSIYTYETLWNNCFAYGCFQNRGTPKWMVKIMENPIEMDDLGGFPTIFGNIHIMSSPQNMPSIFMHFSVVLDSCELTNKFFNSTFLVFLKLHILGKVHHRWLNHYLDGGFFKFFYVYPNLGKWSNLTNIFQRGWNYQLKSLIFLPYAVAEALHGFRGDCRRSLWGAFLLKFDIHPRRKTQESYLYTPKTNYVPWKLMVGRWFMSFWGKRPIFRGFCC